MNTVLDSAQLKQFNEDGYVFPVPVLQDREARSLRDRLQALEARQGGALASHQRSKSFLLLKWVADLIRDPRVLDPIEQLIGPDILCWNTIFWIKNVGSKTFISWHQDTRYWGLSSDRVVTAWLALSPASLESGCMKVMPGTHRGDVLPHEDTFHKDNMLTRGQTITAGVNDEGAVYMPLEPGQMSLHNYRVAHASGPNLSDDRRIGLSMHFMPTRTKQLIGQGDSAALVRGVDHYAHFELPPLPKCDVDEEAVLIHAKAVQTMNEILYSGAKAKPSEAATPEH